MRAMEYEPVQCRCEPRGVWDMFRWCLIHGAQVEPTKKLTDAECAAEYWQAVAVHWFTALDPVGDPELAIEAAWSEVETWHRFATCPHASEVE